MSGQPSPQPENPIDPVLEVLEGRRTLLPHHRRILEEGSAIHPDVIAERGYWSAERWQDAMGLRFSSTQLRPECFPALMIPQHDPTGELIYHAIRYDTPRKTRDGKVIKYEQPKNVGLRLDVPPRCVARLRNPEETIWMTEGAKKADALASRGLVAVNTPGVDGWRSPTAIPDLFGIPFKAKAGKDVQPRGLVLAYDSDVMTKPAVRFALIALSNWTRQKGAEVSVIDWRAMELPEGSKTGVDDFLATYSLEDLEDLLIGFDEWLEATKPETEIRDCPYEMAPEGLYWLKPDKQGLGHYEKVLLANFGARISADIAEDDGADEKRIFEIQAQLKERSRAFRVPAEKFSPMAWVTEQLGASAILYPGNGIKDHARAAIQLLSGQIPERVVFTHLGWRKIEDRWFYLHAGGAIGAEGAIDGVDVAVNGALAGYQLPEPPSGEDLVGAIRASLEVLNVAPKGIMVPLLAAVYRAVIGNVDHAIHLVGPTGAGKSVLAALIQQHYGAGMDARHLPAGWSSTGNALEMLAFLAKDALMTVDDFVPTGSTQDRAKLNREAERLLRGQGNQAGRQRLTADATLRHGKPPRGLILSTGEDCPAGQSLRARLLILEVDPSDIRWDRVSQCQRDAAGGTYAKVLSAYIKWLAPRYGNLHESLAGRVAALRAAAHRASLHKRVPEIVANLVIGLASFLDFGKEAGAFGEAESQQLWAEWWKALLEPAEKQARFQATVEPARRFITLLVAALSSGQAHLTGANGEHPEDPDAWGWRRRASAVAPGYSVDEWTPQGPWVGWIDGEEVYLEPEASYNAVQLLGQRSGEPLLIASQTLRKRLKEQGFLAAVDATRKTSTVRRRYNNQKIERNVLCLHISSLYPSESTDITDIAENGLFGAKQAQVERGPNVSFTPVDVSFLGSDLQETDNGACEPGVKNRAREHEDSDSTSSNVSNVGNVSSIQGGGPLKVSERPGDSLPQSEETDNGSEKLTLETPEKPDIGEREEFSL